MFLSIYLLLSLAVIVLADPGARPSNIPLKFNRKSRRYVAEVVMGSHGRTQTLNFTISTGLRYSAVASTRCAACASEDVYDPGSSASFQSLRGTATVEYGGIDLSGSLAREDCNLTVAQGSSEAPWPYPNQTLVLVNGSQSALDLFSEGITGVMGLSTRAPDGGSVLDTVLGKWLSTHTANTTFEYGMALNDLSSTVSQAQRTTDDQDAEAGQLHMLAPDPTFFNDSQTTWGDATSAVLGQGSLPDLILFPSDFVCNTMQGWAFTWSDGKGIQQDTTSAIAFEPLYPFLVFPTGYAISIYTGISGARQVPATQPGAPLQWSVPCTTTNLTWTPQFGTLRLPMNNLVQRIEASAIGDDSCVGAIQGWADPGTDSYLLGSPFMTNAYIIHQTSRDGHNKVGIAPRLSPSQTSQGTTSKSVTTAALVGGIVGGLIGGIFFSAVIGALLWRRRRRKKARSSANDLSIPIADGQTTTAADASENYDTITPFTTPPNSAGISSPGTESTFASQQASAMQEVKGGGRVDFGGRQMSVMAAPPGPTARDDQFHNSSAWYEDMRHSALPPAYNE